MNIYSFGAVGSHKVVLVRMQESDGLGKATAEGLSYCRSTFPNIALAVVIDHDAAVPFQLFRPGGKRSILDGIVFSLGFFQQNPTQEHLPQRHLPQQWIDTPKNLPRGTLHSLSESQHDNVVGRLPIFSFLARNRFHAALPEYLDDLRKKAQSRAHAQAPGHDEIPDIHLASIASLDSDLDATEHGIFLPSDTENLGLAALPCIFVSSACGHGQVHMSHPSRMPNAATTTAACVMSLVRDMEHLSSRGHTHTSASEPATQTIRQPVTFGANVGRQKMPPRVHFLVPYPKPGSFIGRDSILQKLEETLQTAPSQPRIALLGVGGIGKTHIALAYAHQFSGRYPDRSVFWVHATSEDSFHQAYASIAQDCQMPGYDDPDADVLSLVKSSLESRNNGSWLLIIDDVNDNYMLGSSQNEQEANPSAEKRDLASLVPGCPHGYVLVTTRNTGAAVMLAQGGPVVEVGQMQEQESEELIRAGLDGVDVTAEDVGLLSTRLAHFPLALAQAVAYIKTNIVSIGRYLQLLDESHVRMPSVLSNHPGNLGRVVGKPKAFALTWEISFNQMKKKNSLAHDLLSLMSFLHQDSIPLILLLHYKERRRGQPGASVARCKDPSEDAQLQEALSLLKDFVFLWEENQDSLAMHSLVQSATRDMLQTKGLTSHFAGEAMLAISELYPYGTYESRKVCGAYLPHVHAVLRYDLAGTKVERIAKASLLHNAAGYLVYRGQWNVAEEFQRQAVEMKEKLFGKNHASTLSSMANLASTYDFNGRWNDAEALQADVLGRRKQALGGDHPHTLASMVSMASTYNHQGRWTDSEALLTKVLELRMNRLGAEHADTLASMASLASTYNLQGRWKEAESLQEQVLRTRRRLLGEEHPLTLASKAGLAAIYDNQGRWEAAERLQTEVLETRKSVLGERHPETLACIASLASTYSKQGLWIDSGALQAYVLEKRTAALGEDHPSTLISMMKLASVYSQQGRDKQAEDLQSQVLLRRRRMFGEEHPDTLGSMGSLAGTYVRQGRLQEAEGLQMDVVKLLKRNIGEEHPSTLASIANLAWTYSEQGRWKEAETLQGQVLEARGRVLGDDHPDTLASSASLASTFCLSGQLTEAEKLQVRVVQIASRVLGTKHPFTLASIYDLESIHNKQGRQEMAETSQTQVPFAGRRLTFKGGHPSSAKSDGLFRRYEGDSGYASGSRVATLRLSTTGTGPVHGENASPDATTEHGQEASRRGEEEAKSVASDEGDIGSQTSEGTTYEDLTGKALIRVFLAEEPRFRLLCENAMSNMSRQRFVENMRRLLKSLHKGLLSEAKSEAERAVAALLCSRRGRLRISQQLVEHIEQEKDELVTHDRLDLHASLQERCDVENWLAHASETTFAEQNTADDCWGSEESASGDELEGDEFPHTSELRRFLRNSQSFQEVLGDFLSMFLPADVGDVLLSIPKGNVWLSREQPRSMINRMKVWVEDKTQVTWNWWPLEPSKRELRKGECRIFWQCTCGTQQWDEVSLDQHEFVEKFLAVWDDKPTSPHWCRKTGFRVPLSQSFILFGVQGPRRTLTPAQILVTSRSTDSSVFQDLRACYRTHRGWLRYWFSIWTLDHCTITKFNRLTPDRMVPEYKDLPRHTEYEYSPRAGSADARNPPLRSHLFDALFYTCQSPCNWKHFHDCIPPPKRSIYLERIPKRTTSFEADDTSSIWGFEAVFSPSFARTVLYHIIIILAPFVFSLVWLRFHPEDLQNAYTPASIVVAGVSLFWNMNTAWISRGQDRDPERKPM
ncbi:hypothetical protein RJ55_05406 [Drechmeria coniospora]|nr:hypothetical protein RJ55_05406 [Drechmeria coniospora]